MRNIHYYVLSRKKQKKYWNTILQITSHKPKSQISKIVHENGNPDIIGVDMYSDWNIVHKGQDLDITAVAQDISVITKYMGCIHNEIPLPYDDRKSCQRKDKNWTISLIGRTHRNKHKQAN